MNFHHTILASWGTPLACHGAFKRPFPRGFRDTIKLHVSGEQRDHHQRDPKTNRPAPHPRLVSQHRTAGGDVIEGLQSVRAASKPGWRNSRSRRTCEANACSISAPGMAGSVSRWSAGELQVVALDATRNPKLLLARDLLDSKIEYVNADISRISAKELGHFDIVLFMGVLYHLKHPLLALENVCEMTDELACLESYVIDDGRDLNAPPILEFYEGTELRGQFDNWCGPNTSCLIAMARAAGFASVTLESVMEQRAHVTCLRKWPRRAGRRARAVAPVRREQRLERSHVSARQPMTIFHCGSERLRPTRPMSKLARTPRVRLKLPR